MKLPAQLTIRDHFGKEWPFDTLEAFEIFLKNQADFWNQRLGIASQNPIANQFIQRCNNFQTILNQIQAWKPELENWNASSFQANFESLINGQIGSSWLWSGYPFIEKWLELSQTSPNIADAFFEVFIQKTTSRSNVLDCFQGYIIAYEFLNQDKTNINKRRNSEIKSLNQLRDQLTVKHNELIGKVDTFETDLTSWKDTTKSDFSTWHTTQKTLLDDTVLTHSKNFQAQNAKWIENVITLENRYREKLRFESPATYWKSSAKRLRTQGSLWLLGMTLLIVGTVIWFSNYFLAWLINDKPTKLGLDSLEGILIFAAILSSIAFLIKSFSKLTFSTFHLMRDAEEREQLTHLYIALRDGKDDDPEARKIILQALFSRSDTGLLAGDHGPTMPTVQDAIKIINPKG